MTSSRTMYWASFFLANMALLSGCAGLQTSSQPKTAEVANISSGIQVGLGPCVTAQPPTGRGLADSALTALVSKGVNLLGNALTDAGNDKTWKSVGTRNLPGGAAALPQCIQILRGRFKTDEAPTAAAWLKEYAPSGNPLSTLTASGLWPADRPDFFFEGAIVTSEDKTAVTIRPLFAVLNSPQGTRIVGGEDRSLAIFLAFSPAGVHPNLDTNPAATLVLGPMTPGRPLRFPPGSAAKTSTPYEASWFTMSDADVRKPLTVTALVSETQPGSPFFAFLASVFNDDSVKKAVTDRANLIVVPGAQAAAAQAADKQQQQAAGDVDSKLADALAKLADCKAATTDVVSKGAAAKASLRSFVTADLALATPSKKIADADINLINLYAPDTVATKCNDVYEKLTGKRL